MSDNPAWGVLILDEMPTSTYGLLERMRAGDQEAFTALFRKYSPRLAVLVHYRLGTAMRGKIEVDDVLQETFLTAFRQLPGFSYRKPGSFMNWLSRIAEHAIVDAARYQTRQKRSPAEILMLRTAGDSAGVDPLDSTTPSCIFASRERLARTLARLDALPEEYRTVIVMAKLECLSTGEIADRLGLTREAVAVLLHRAVKSLRAAGKDSEHR
jgi:RNA polymerase sigma-70 factor, ECF subfamily